MIYSEEEAAERMLEREHVTRATSDGWHSTVFSVGFDNGCTLRGRQCDNLEEEPDEGSGRYLVELGNVPPWSKDLPYDGKTVGRQRLREMVAAIDRSIELPFGTLTDEEQKHVSKLKETGTQHYVIVKRISRARVRRGVNVLENMRRYFYCSQISACVEEEAAYGSAENVVKTAIEATQESTPQTHD